MSETPPAEPRHRTVYTGAPVGQISWEEAASQVLLFGDTSLMGKINLEWKTTFTWADQVQTDFRHIEKHLEAWTGDAGEVYRQKLRTLAAEIAKLLQECRGIAQVFDEASAALAPAQSAMPVPATLVPELKAARNRGETVAVGPGGFWNSILAHLPKDATEEIDIWRNFFAEQEAKARTIHSAVNAQYEAINGKAPVVDRSWSQDRTENVDLGTSSPAMASGAGPGHGGGGGAPVGHLPSASAVHGGYGYQTPSSGSVSSFDSPEAPALPATSPVGGGLAGLGGAPGAPELGSRPGLGGIGTGVGGAGAGLGGGAGVSVGALGPGLGQAVSPPAGRPSGPGSRAAGRGAGTTGASGRGAEPGAGGMMGGGPAGTAGRGENARRSSWLVEDEDVWGADSDVSPPVLGRD